MPTITTDAQKLVRDFHKSDALAQTNQIWLLFYAWHRRHKKLFSQDLKLETKNAGTFF